MSGLRAAGTAALAVTAAAGASAAARGLRAPFDLGVVAGPVPLLDLRFGVVPLAAILCGLTALLAATVALWSGRRGREQDGVLLAAFTATLLAVLCARSVAAFLACWEAMAVASLVLVAAQHDRRGVRRAAFTYALVSQAGALCITVMFGLLLRGSGDPSFDALTRAAPHLPDGLRAAALALALLGFGSKAGLMPLHFWLPRAHPVAAPSASALLSGGMLAVALYGLGGAFFVWAAPAPVAWGHALVALGALSAIGGSLYALVDRDLKRMLANSSVENVGIVVLAFGVAILARERLPVASALALAAAYLHACNHGIFKALLFLAAGATGEAAGTTDLERLGGLVRALPGTAAAFGLAAAAAIGAPPFNGFVSEWLAFRAFAAAAVLDGAPRVSAVVALAALALAGGLTVAAFARAGAVVFLGRPRAGIEPSRERPSAAAAYALPGAACVLLGMFAAPVFDPLAAAVAPFVHGPAAPAGVPVLLPLGLAFLPLCGAVASVFAARGARTPVPWACGSPAVSRTQYSATAFAKPLRTIFAFALRPVRRRVVTGPRWFPQTIRYRTESRYLVDEVARAFGALALRTARRARLLQGGSLRLYLAYAVAAAIVVVVVAR